MIIKREVEDDEGIAQIPHDARQEPSDDQTPLRFDDDRDNGMTAEGDAAVDEEVQGVETRAQKTKRLQ